MAVPPTSEGRIERIRRRYQEEIPRISIERARFFTERWQETDETEVALPVRVALCMLHVFENMTLYLDPDDRIAGARCETFLGAPVDIERGLYNDILDTELRRSSLIWFRLKRFLRFLYYAISRGKIWRILRASTRGPSSLPLPVDTTFKPMPRREVNPFTIDPRDERILKNSLFGYWKGRTVSEHVERALRDARLFSRQVRDFMWAMALTPSRQVLVLSPTAALCTYQGHLIPDFERVLKKGLLALREEVRQEVRRNPGLPQEQRDFLWSLEIALDGVITFARRLALHIESERDGAADEGRRKILSAMLDAARTAPLHPAGDFRQAVQAIWTVKCAMDLANPTNVHALGRLDQLLHPYYAADRQAGRIGREEACELLEELLLKIMSHNCRPESNVLGSFYLRYEGSEPVTLGGVDAGGNDATNELTYLFLEAAERSRAVTNVVLRLHEGTPDGLHLALADAFYRGASNLSMMNDEVHVEGLIRRGFAEADARNYAITGCTDVICPGKTGGLSVSGLMLARLLDITMRNGDLQTLAGRVGNAGIRTGDPDRFPDFDAFVDAFVAQAGYAMGEIVQASNLRDREFAERMPAPYVSAFIDGCLESRRDVTRGGAVYDLSLVNMINSVANVVDSLYVIKRLVFEERCLTFRQLLEAVDSDFAGHEDVKRRVQGLSGKWGNGNPETDGIARQLTTRLFEAVEKHRGFKGSPWAPVINSMTSHTIDGRLSIATPDGRGAAMPYASSCNPYNVEENGVTGVLRSVAAVDFRHVLGCSVNIRLHPSAIGRTPESRMKWVHLLKAFFRLGGSQLQPTVASSEELRAAQQDPDAHRGLLVKVGGYSAYFTDLGREIQNEIISRTEHGVAV